MELTPEKRQQILRGDDGLGHQDATQAPRHMQDRIIEIRLAQAEHRSVPAPSADYIRTAEARMSTLGRRAVEFGRKLFKPAPTPPSEDWRKEPEWQRTVQTALNTLADISAKEKDRKIEAERNAAEVKATLFPWEN